MKKKAQVLITILWILLVLTLLSISIAHRVSLTLRISCYQRDNLKAFYLAKAGLNRAICEIMNDQTLNYDTLIDNWADNEGVFKRITFDANQDSQYATVSYDAKFGARDEERKININTASKELLVVLLEKCEVGEPLDIANNILIWRGDIPDTDRIYENLGYPCKANKFSNIEELLLVKGVRNADFAKLKDLVTVYTGGPLNINTSSKEVLTILAHSIARRLLVGDNFADNVVEKIIGLKNINNGYFKERGDIRIEPAGDEEANIFNNLMGEITLQSNNFLIEVTGNVSKIKSKIRVVYSRNGKKILYWHES